MALDLSQEDLPHALGRSCHDTDIPTFFSWPGVIPVRHQTSNNLREDMAGHPAFRGITPDFNAGTVEDTGGRPGRIPFAPTDARVHGHDDM